MIEAVEAVDSRGHPVDNHDNEEQDCGVSICLRSAACVGVFTWQGLEGWSGVNRLSLRFVIEAVYCVPCEVLW